MTVEIVTFALAISAAAAWGAALVKMPNRLSNAINYIVPILAWLLHVVIFTGVIVFARDWTMTNREFVIQWGKALVLHNVLTLLFRVIAIHARGFVQ